MNFLIEQAVEVESPQPAQVKVYDYYEQELTVTKVKTHNLIIEKSLIINYLAFYELKEKDRENQRKE